MLIAIALICSLTLAVGLTACGSSKKSITVRESPDKYTWYVKNYIDKNLGNIGYTSLGDDRRDYYGKYPMLLSVISTDGTYVNVSDSEAIKNYVVID